MYPVTMDYVLVGEKDRVRRRIDDFNLGRKVSHSRVSVEKLQ